MNGFGKVLIRFVIEKLSTAKAFIQMILAGASASRKFSLMPPLTCKREVCVNTLVVFLKTEINDQKAG